MNPGILESDFPRGLLPQQIFNWGPGHCYTDIYWSLGHSQLGQAFSTQDWAVTGCWGQWQYFHDPTLTCRAYNPTLTEKHLHESHSSVLFSTPRTIFSLGTVITSHPVQRDKHKRREEAQAEGISSVLELLNFLCWQDIMLSILINKNVWLFR